MRVIIYLPHFPLDLGSEDSIVLLITSTNSNFHTLLTLRYGYPSSLLEYAGRIPGGPPLSLVLGERPEKRGRLSGIAVKKGGEEKRRTRGKDGNGVILFGILPEE